MGKIRRFATRNRWAEAEIEVLRINYAVTSRSQISQLLPGRCHRSIECKAFDLGLRRPQRVGRSADETRAAKRADMAARRRADPDGVRAYQRNLHHGQRDASCAKMRAYNRRRFFWRVSNRFKGEDAASARDLARLWKGQRGRCALSGERLTRKNAQVEHRVPKCRGGGDNIENLQWATKIANFSKRDMTEAEFLALCRSVVEVLGRRIEMVEDICKINIDIEPAGRRIAT